MGTDPLAGVILFLEMPKKQKTDLRKVNASLNTRCVKCGHSITPAELRRVDCERVDCPKCGERFNPVPKETRDLSRAE